MPTIQVRYKLTAAQIAYRKSDALYRGMVGGIGSGKSWIGSLDLIRRARPGRLYMAVGPTYVMLRDASLRSFVQHAQQLNYLKTFRRSDMAVVLGNGAEVVFRTAEDPDRLRGPNLSGVWLDEASLMAKEAFEVAIGRLREGGEQGFLGATFTPKGRHHWTFGVFASGRPDSAVFRSRTTDNPFLPKGFADAVRRQYTADLARQELEGEFLDEDAAFLFPDDWLVHSARRAETLRGRPRKAKGIGIDTGEGVSKTSMSAVDDFGLIEQASKRTPDTDVITGEALAFMRRHGVPPDRVNFDRGGGGKQAADRLRAQGYPVQTVAFGDPVTLAPRRGKAPIGDRFTIMEERSIYKNRRAEMYGTLRNLLDPTNEQGFAIGAEYTELRRQLAPIPLTYDGEGRMYLIPKNKPNPNYTGPTLTALLGCSPDEADSLVLAVHAMLNRPTRAKAGAM